jgi:hypothetical protein
MSSGSAFFQAFKPTFGILCLDGKDLLAVQICDPLQPDELRVYAYAKTKGSEELGYALQRIPRVDHVHLS